MSNYKTGQQKILHHNTRDSENSLRRVCQCTADNTLHVHTVLRQLWHSASRQTSQYAEAEAGTTVAEAVVLLLAETNDHGLYIKQAVV